MSPKVLITGNMGYVGPAFLRIWLDSRTAIQDLRVQLLGEQGGVLSP